MIVMPVVKLSLEQNAALKSNLVQVTAKSL